MQVHGCKYLGTTLDSCLPIRPSLSNSRTECGFVSSPSQFHLSAGFALPFCQHHMWHMVGPYSAARVQLFDTEPELRELQSEILGLHVEEPRKS